ncbi:SEL1-like repeat protein [Acidiphilium sp.]|uniref:SEL1-like repeat protein n=1 Tax=Acidiphilium sp. TaxID=527 RepID=UPI003D050B7D
MAFLVAIIFVFVPNSAIAATVPKAVNAAATHTSLDEPGQTGVLHKGCVVRLPADFANDLRKYQVAASRGDALAIFYLGEANYFGCGVLQNRQLAVQYLRKAAAGRIAAAATLLGTTQYIQAQTPTQRTAALQWIHQGAHDGDAIAQRDLGIIALHGNSHIDQLSARHWLHLAALQGDVVAQRLLGEIESQDVTNKEALGKAAFWLGESAKHGDSVALTDLERLWSISKRRHFSGIEPKTFTAVKVLVHSPQATTEIGNFYFGQSASEAAIAVALYRQASISGFGPAFFGLADAYLFGRGTPINYHLARTNFAIAAADGDARANVNLGIMYDRGVGVKRNLSRAAHYYNLAAKQGSAEGAFYLGQFYQDGAIGKIDVQAARRWYRIAAERGLSIAQLQLASMPNPLYANAVSQRRRLFWLQRAARSGNTTAEIEIAEVYRRGEGVAVNRRIALRWLDDAVHAGNRQALLDRALFHASGSSDANVAKQGRTVLRHLAQMGNTRAQFDLGALYARGLNVHRDSRIAAYWWQMAANNHNSKADLALAIAYESGFGVPQNDKKSHHFLKLAQSETLDPQRQQIIESEIHESQPR